MDSPAQIAARGIEHALDLSRDGVTLFRRQTGTSWAEISHAPLQLGSLGRHLSRLAELVRRGQTGPAHVQVWLPMDQIDARVIPDGALPEDGGALRALFGRDDQGDDPLVIDTDIGVGPDGRVVAAVRQSVLTETRDFLSPYGFQVTLYTIRERYDGLSQAPMFQLDEPPVKGDARRFPAMLIASAGAAAAVVLAVGLWMITAEGPLLDPQTEIAQVALAPGEGRAVERDFSPPLPLPAQSVPTAVALLDSGAEQSPKIASRSAWVHALVRTPLPPEPSKTAIPALDSDADFRDTIPWGFVPALDLVEMQRDIPIFSAVLATQVAALAPPPESAPLYSGVAVPGTLAPAAPQLQQGLARAGVADPALNIDQSEDWSARRRGTALVDRQAIEFAALHATPGSPDVRTTLEALRPTFPEVASLQDPRPAGPDLRDSIGRARSVAIERISLSGIRIRREAPDEVPPNRPFAQPEPTAPSIDDTETVTPPLALAALPDTPPAGGAGLVGATPVAIDQPETPSITVVTVRPDIIPPGGVAVPAPATPQNAEPADTSFVSVGENPRVIVLAALPPVIPPTRPRPEPDNQQIARLADDLATDAKPLLEVEPPAAADIATLILRSQEDALAPSPIAITRQRSPAARPSTMVRAERDRMERLAALTPSVNALGSSARPAHRPRGLVPTNLAVVPSNNNRTVPSPSRPAEVARTVPTLPTSASVARAATVRDALPMRRMALIGVYGKSGSRHALVRLKNGRFIKVEPGDRVDGYDVAAISADAIRMRRRGRDTLLVIPK